MANKLPTTNDSGKGIKQIPLSHMIAKELRRRIWSGEIEFGERLYEVTLAEEMDVSRSSLREALQNLEFEGLVINKARKGTLVNSFTLKDMEEISEARLMLEVNAFTNACTCMTESHFNELEELIMQMKEMAYGENWNELFDLDINFHRYIVNLCGNSRIIKFYDLIQVQIRTFLSRLVKFYKQRKELLWQEHDELLKALRTKNPDLIEIAVKKHIEDSSKSMINYYFREKEKGQKK